MFFEDLLADELFILKLAHITVKYLVFSVLSHKIFKNLGAFTVRHHLQSDIRGV